MWNRGWRYCCRKKNGKAPDAEDVARLCEQILEFWRAHLGAAPQQLRELLWVVQGLMLEVTQAEAAKKGLEYSFIRLFSPIHLGGFICPTYSLWDVVMPPLKPL